MNFEIKNIDVDFFRPRNRYIGVIWLENDENIFVDTGLNQATLRNSHDDIRELTLTEKKYIYELIKKKCKYFRVLTIKINKMTEIKVKRTTPKLKFENSILDNVEKYNIAKNLSAYFIGIILMGNNIGSGLISDCGTIHADFQKENNIIFVREIKK